MLRRLLAFLVFGVSVGSLTAAAVAQEDTDASSSDQPTSEAGEPAKEEKTPADAPPPVKAQAEEKPASDVKSEAQTSGALAGWTMETHGYFRAPLAIGISSRPNPGEYDRPGEKDGPSHLQLSYAPNRVMDWSYYSFAYTRLQEQDWAEISFHAKRKHVDAAVGIMGYWFAAAGFRNPDASQTMAYLKLDTDVDVLGIQPNIALQMGAWWPGYGYFEKYDTFTLGRFRHIGEQLKFTVPVSPELTVTLEQGFGVARDGKFDYSTANQSPLYAGMVGSNLVAYGNLRADYLKYASLGLHYNREWTRDPDMTQSAGAGQDKSYPAARDAYMQVLGGEINVSLPLAGRLWISPSFIKVRNGWALAGGGGTEVMHSQGGLGVASNYLGWTNSPKNSTGSGSILNIGFTYENSLSNILPDFQVPDVRVSVFGLIARASLDLPESEDKFTPPEKINQLKWGADATYLPLTWLSIMARFDSVSLLNKPGYVFSAITGRLAVFSHYLSGESIYLQFSRYTYGDKMVLAGQVPWGANPLVAGSNELQNKSGGYGFKTPDENVVKIQAQVTF